MTRFTAGHTATRCPLLHLLPWLLAGVALLPYGHRVTNQHFGKWGGGRGGQQDQLPESGNHFVLQRATALISVVSGKRGFETSPEANKNNDGIKKVTGCIGNDRGF